MQENIENNDAFAFDRLPVSVEEIQTYTQMHFLQKEIKGHFIKRLSVWLIISFFKLLPYWLAYRIGTFIGRILYFLKTGKHVALTNLDIVYGDTKSAEGKKAIYRASLLNFGLVEDGGSSLPLTHLTITPVVIISRLVAENDNNAKFICSEAYR